MKGAKFRPAVDFHGSFAVRFWSATYSPEQALSPVDNWDGAYGPTGLDYEVAPDARSALRLAVTNAAAAGVGRLVG